jgi:DNA polymerase-3 subunit alpha
MDINHALSVRSDFSIGESLLQLDHIVEKAKEVGYESVALVDTMSIHGMVDFSNKCKKAGIRPIIGCRIRVYDDPKYRKPPKASGEKEKPNPSFILKVYPTSEHGMKSLLKLLSVAFSAEYFYYHARVGLDEVLALEDVVVSTGDFHNLFHHTNHGRIFERLQCRFGTERTFVELVPINTPLFDTLNAKAVACSVECAAPTLITYPTLYREAGDAGSLEVLNVITTQSKMDVGYRPKQFVKDFFFREPKSLFERVKNSALRVNKWNGVHRPEKWLDGIKNIGAFAALCTYEFKKQPVSLPKMAANEFMTLGAKCLAGWKKRFESPVLGYTPSPEIMPTYRERLKYELSVLKAMGFSGYFLLVEDLVMWAKSNDIIVGPGRGSCFLPGHQVICDKSGLRKSVEDFSVGDKVLAHDGSEQKIVATLEFDRDEEIIELEFDNGVKIECTKDHKFFTRNRGWVIAEELCGEDEFDDVSELAKRLESTPSPSS